MREAQPTKLLSFYRSHRLYRSWFPTSKRNEYKHITSPAIPHARVRSANLFELTPQIQHQVEVRIYCLPKPSMASFNLASAMLLMWPSFNVCAKARTCSRYCGTRSDILQMYFLFLPMVLSQARTPGFHSSGRKSIGISVYEHLGGIAAPLHPTPGGKVGEPTAFISGGRREDKGALLTQGGSRKGWRVSTRPKKTTTMVPRP